jgi:hypothetical protein
MSADAPAKMLPRLQESMLPAFRLSSPGAAHRLVRTYQELSLPPVSLLIEATIFPPSVPKAITATAMTIAAMTAYSAMEAPRVSLNMIPP